MSTAENKKLVQDAFAAWARGEGNAVFNLLADDVHWTVIGSTPVSRTYFSKREFVEGAVKPLGEILVGIGAIDRATLDAEMAIYTFSDADINLAV